MSNPGQQMPSFHDQLERLLVEQLKTQPRNLQARLKLLELYYETQRVGSFMRHAQELSSALHDKTHSTEWQKCASMGRMLAPEAALFSAEGIDRIEFVGSGNNFEASPSPSAPVRRLGDDARFTPLFQDLAKGFEEARADPAFLAKLDMELTFLARRPSPLLHARRLSAALGGAQIYIKREDTSPRDTHLLTSVVGQALLAQRMGRKTLITYTVDGRRGVVTASIAARLGLEALVFMDAERNARHATTPFRMWLLGGKLMPTAEDRNGLGLAQNVRDAALEYWLRHSEQSLLTFGLDGAPEPYPLMAREFAASIGRECLRQVRVAAKRAPDLVVTRGGANADALGLLPAMVPEKSIRLVCVEPVAQADAAAKLSPDKQRVAQNILEGLEYPSVVREQRWLRESGRVEYHRAAVELAKKAINDLSRLEGIIPAVETAHAIGWACEAAAKMKPDQVVVVMMAEDAEKDAWDIGRLLGVSL